MPGDLILTIDNGTQSVRALLFDLQGTLLAKHRALIPPYASPQPGWSEQEPQAFWDTVCQACQGLLAQIAAQPGLSPERIAGLALTTQRGTVINLGRDLQPLRPAITWMDQRRTAGVRPVGGLWGLLFGLSGMSRTAAYLQAEAEANWLAAHQPEIWQATEKYVYLSGYLTYRLTGRLVDSTACQVGYMPYDYKKSRYASPWDWKWQALLPVRREMMIDLQPPATILGHLTAEAARETGLPQGLPLVAAASDKACEVIGAGAFEPHIGCLSYGTTATINTTHRRYIEVVPLIPPYPAALPGAYSLEAQVYRGYWMVSWFRDEFGQPEQLLAQDQGIEPEALFDQLVGQVPPGSDGLVLQPYWSPGLKLPGPEARGAVIGFNGEHTRAHLYRAILEGLAYALRDGAERIEKRSRVPIRELRVAGGGSQSDAAMQLTADIFGLPAARPHVYEASGLGAAIDAAVGLGLHPGFEQAAAAMTHLGDTFSPDPRAHATYEELYRGVYLKMYDQLRPLYEKMYRAAGRH
ncbi:MAG: FGGY-family carbohydrate kinase [Chloroflexota bacterium]